MAAVEHLDCDAAGAAAKQDGNPSPADDFNVACVICMCTRARQLATNTLHMASTTGFGTHVEHIATLDGCAHSFCTKCIELWIAHRHADPWCPVCRQPITGYLTADTPPVQQPGPSSQATPQQQRDGSQTTQLQYSTTHHHQDRGDLSDTASSVPAVRHVTVQPQPRPPSPHSPEIGWLPRYRHRSHASRSPRNHRMRRPTTVRPAHRHLCASEEASLRYRVSVYRHGLLAIPPGAPRDTGVPPLVSLSDAPRIRSWIRRDLQALLGEDDVALLVDHVRGVLAEAVRRRGEGQAVVDSWAHHQLRPYLGSRVGHFWHELRCFAGCPYTVSTYDGMVRYPAPPPRASGAS